VQPLLDAISEAGLKPVVLTTVQPHSSRFAVKRISGADTVLPMRLADLKNAALVGCSDDRLLAECKQVLSKMAVTDSSAALLEQATQRQSDCLLWHDHRIGRLTASNFHAASKTNPLKPARTLLNTVMTATYRSVPKSEAQRWGSDHEATAREVYAGLYSATHDSHSVTPAGLTISKSQPYLAASPDGWVSDSCCGKGVLEVKCPFSIRRDMPDTAAYLSRDADSCLQLDDMHPYYAQVQGQMNICDVEYCDFVVWTEQGIAVVRVKRNTEYWQNLSCKLAKLYQCSILPRLLTGEERSLDYVVD